MSQAGAPHNSSAAPRTCSAAAQALARTYRTAVADQPTRIYPLTAPLLPRASAPFARQTISVVAPSWCVRPSSVRHSLAPTYRPLRRRPSQPHPPVDPSPLLPRAFAPNPPSFQAAGHILSWLHPGAPCASSSQLPVLTVSGSDPIMSNSRFLRCRQGARARPQTCPGAAPTPMPMFSGGRPYSVSPRRFSSLLARRARLLRRAARLILLASRELQRVGR